MTRRTGKPSAAKSINVQGVDEKIAALVGVTPDQIMINDVKVNPISKNVYLSASRGRGPDAMPLIVRVDASGKVTTLSLDNAKRRFGQPFGRARIRYHRAAKSAHVDHHRYGLRERQPDGRRPVERRMVFCAALDSVPV